MSESLDKTMKKEYTPPFWAEKVKASMKAKGVSQEFIAAKLGVARSAVGHYFSGKNALPISSVDTLCKYTGITRDVFFELPSSHQQVKDENNSGYNTNQLSTHATKTINAIKALDKSGKLTKEIANSITTILKSYK